MPYDMVECSLDGRPIRPGERKWVAVASLSHILLKTLAPMLSVKRSGYGDEMKR